MAKSKHEIIEVNKVTDYVPSLNMIFSEVAPTMDLFDGKGTIYHYAENHNENVRLVNWGSYNNFPQLVDELINNDADAPVIIQNKVNFNLGQYLEPYRIVVQEVEKNGVKELVKKHVPALDQKILDWLDDNEEELYEALRSAAINFEKYGNYFTEFITNYLKQVISVRSIDCHHMRPVEKSSTEIKIGRYGVQTDFDRAKGVSNYTILPSYDAVKSNLSNKKFIFHGRDAMPGSPYFGVPVWIGSWKNLQLSRMVLDGQISALKNGWNIKFKITIHQDYYNDCKNADEKKKKKQELIDRLHTVLAGTKNQNKVLVTEMVGNWSSAKFHDLVKIEAIDNNKENQMLSKLLESKNIAAPRAFNITPELSGIPIGSNLSSGSEITQQYNLHLLLKTPIPRKILLRFIKIISDSYGWGVRWRIKDAVLTQKNEDKKGFTEK